MNATIDRETAAFFSVPIEQPTLYGEGVCRRGWVQPMPEPPAPPLYVPNEDASFEASSEDASFEGSSRTARILDGMRRRAFGAITVRTAAPVSGPARPGVHEATDPTEELTPLERHVLRERLANDRTHKEIAQDALARRRNGKAYHKSRIAQIERVALRKLGYWVRSVTELLRDPELNLRRRKLACADIRQPLGGMLARLHDYLTPEGQLEVLHNRSVRELERGSFSLARYLDRSRELVRKL